AVPGTAVVMCGGKRLDVVADCDRYAGGSLQLLLKGDFLPAEEGGAAYNVPERRDSMHVTSKAYPDRREARSTLLVSECGSSNHRDNVADFATRQRFRLDLHHPSGQVGQRRVKGRSGEFEAKKLRSIRSDFEGF